MYIKNSNSYYFHRYIFNFIMINTSILKKFILLFHRIYVYYNEINLEFTDYLEKSDKNPNLDYLRIHISKVVCIIQK